MSGEATKGVVDHGTQKRPPKTVISGISQHDRASEGDEDDEDEDVAEIGTHRNDNQESQQDLVAVNRFNAVTKN